MTGSHRNEDRGGERRWAFNGVEYPTRKLMCEARREEYVRLPDEEAQLRVLGRFIAGGWTVARTEQYIDALAGAPATEKRELCAFRLLDARLFINSVRLQLDLVRSAGIPAVSEQTVTDRVLLIPIRIPKPDASRR